jgi:DNA-binding Lrp family transcriptional regulator
LPLLGRGRKEQEVERELIELRERCNLLEKKLEEAVEKTERAHKLLSEAVYKIIVYLKEKDLEWSEEEKRPRLEAKSVTVTKEKPLEERLNETEMKLLEEVDKRGVLTVRDCRDHIGKSPEHVSRTLKQMVEKGLLTRERRGKTFYYRRVEK